MSEPVVYVRMLDGDDVLMEQTLDPSAPVEAMAREAFALGAGRDYVVQMRDPDADVLPDTEWHTVVRSIDGEVLFTVAGLMLMLRLMPAGFTP